MWVTSSLLKALTPTAVALGNFDGVHRGHRQVVQPILGTQPFNNIACESEVTIPPDVNVKPHLENNAAPPDRSYATVVTFTPHPREFFTGEKRQLLTPLDQKVQQLRSLNVEQLVLLPFDRELANLTPEEFVEKILVEQLKADKISVGQDFCFGRGRTGTSGELAAIAARFGVEVNIVPLHTCRGERISSSAIRESLLAGDVERANRLLGRSYTLVGEVVEGQKLGRTLGFPTANLKLPPEKFLPSNGVYCVRVSIEESEPPATEPKNPWLPGVMNIGCRPTLNGIDTTIEVHLLNWSGDLYGKSLSVSLEQFLRSEQKFSSLEELKAQIQQDASTATAFFIQ